MQNIEIFETLETVESELELYKETIFFGCKNLRNVY